MAANIPARIIDDGLKAGLFSAASYAVARRGELLLSGAAGRVDFEPGAMPVKSDTLFDVASVGKPAITATSIMILVERGLLSLTQSVGKILEPRFGSLAHLDVVEVRQLLTHTSGLPPIPRKIDPPADQDEPSDLSRVLEAALTTPLLRDPGVGYTYSDVGYILLWEIIELVTGISPMEFARREILRPLGMHSSEFLPNGSDIVRTDAAVPAGVVHDPRARALGGASGHAGLFSTAPDLLRYVEAIRTGGAPILSRASVARMSRSQCAPGVGAMSYGWFCAGNDFLPSGDLFSDVAFGHSGFTGCLLLIDPAYDVSAVLLSNRVLNTSVDGVPFLRLRRNWLNAVAAAATS
ncbi:MAG: serine hydrolase [Capsulimonadaceae bacterium]|nr:serine hydrolase [Capsulimonadaceae bacterium]